MKYLTLLLAVFCAAVLFAQPRIQFIHNSPDDAASVVDIYSDDVLLFDDFAFRTASPFVDAPIGVEFTISVAPQTSMSVADAFASFPFTMVEDEKFIMVVNGITGLSSTQYNPSPPLSIDVFEGAREEAIDPVGLSFAIHQGSIDAPTLDFYQPAVNIFWADNIPYTEFAGYYEYPASISNSQWSIQTEDGVLIEQYLMDGTDYPGVALVLLTSGFLDPSMNGDGPAFGIWWALGEGGPLLEVPIVPENDVPCDAIELSTDGTVGVFTTAGSLVANDEAAISPPQTGCQTQDGWCAEESGITGSVWFSFIATGTEASISTCHDETTIDTQVAVYSGTNCADFGTMTLVGANDNVFGGCASGTSTYASMVNLTDLVLGEDYWVLVDGYNGASGEFAISIDQAVGLSETRSFEFGMLPNPADEKLWITSPENLESISIIDLQGRIAISQAGRLREIDITHLAPGVYQVAVSVDDRFSYQKLIIE
jgi:hypothetical protein